MRKQGTGTPDALSSGSGTGYVGQHVGSGRLVLVLLTPLMLSSSLIFRGWSFLWSQEAELRIQNFSRWHRLAITALWPSPPPLEAGKGAIVSIVFCASYD